MNWRRLALAAAVLTLLAPWPGCGHPDAGSVDLSKTQLGIENEVREPVKPASKPPVPRRP
jgi:hypothetical protein